MLDPPLQQHSFGGHRPKLAVTCADIPVRYIDLLKQKFVTATLTLPTEGQLVTHFVCSRPKPEAEALGAKLVPQDELLQESDYVFITVPLTNETRHMINESTLAKMKPTAVLVNVARGDIVDQRALVAALKNGTIFAAGLDVVSPEPLPADDELLRLPNAGKPTAHTRRRVPVGESW